MELILHMWRSSRLEFRWISNIMKLSNSLLCIIALPQIFGLLSPDHADDKTIQNIADRDADALEHDAHLMLKRGIHPACVSAVLFH
jgi:hypothetical protein